MSPWAYTPHHVEWRTSREPERALKNMGVKAGGLLTWSLMAILKCGRNSLKETIFQKKTHLAAEK
jgi:hypothetical protein